MGSQVVSSCPCCGRSSFGGSGDLASESYWKSKYGYSVKSDEKNPRIFVGILNKVSNQGVQELKDFSHFLSWRFEWYSKRSAKSPSSISWNWVAKDALKHRNQCWDFLDKKLRQD